MFTDLWKSFMPSRTVSTSKVDSQRHLQRLRLTCCWPSYKSRTASAMASLPLWMWERRLRSPYGGTTPRSSSRDGSFMRLLVEVWSESHRCILAQFVHWDIPVFFFLIFFRGWAVRVVFSCHFVHSGGLLLGEANYLRANHDTGSRWKRLWIQSKFFLMHLIRVLWTTKSSFCASVLLCPGPWSLFYLMT